ncbi:hypothetical protein [Palleronia sp. LCG004]|uniref:hypothetical protein n=1 Tax=Palleronia sp. LCG004 TaxID=3079304 RepID=UPI002942EABB|nr:hypothetical protein [Palleronia sp. LCG004]WOI57973.1 hypothetical protein RVY76_15335 [Palleronia sp. LCG004]
MTRRSALGLVGLIVLAAYAVPYLILGDIARWWASFLFWTLSGVAIIALNWVATRDLGDGE